MTTETPTKPQRPRTKPDPELSAVRRVTQILEKLPHGSRQRVLRFAAERVESDAKAVAAAQFQTQEGYWGGPVPVNSAARAQQGYGQIG